MNLNKQIIMTTNNEKTINKSTWLITAKTNLHVGDESSTGYGLIDKSVQRDALMKLPCINSSSLKGALNEFCCYAKNENGEPVLAPTQLFNIFGDYKKGGIMEKTEKAEKRKDSQKGNTIFFDSGILFLPVQDDNDLYKLAYCDEVINTFIKKAEMFGDKKTEGELLERVGNKANRVSKEKFVKLCSDDELPIIARNVLENGESKNLWYEQVIPSETIFYTFLQSPDSDFIKHINNKIVQIGANATIGYGYCKFTKI